MGQVALGFRSLLIKLAIFFVMAALLAWALGGTLWPRAEVVHLDPVSFDGRDWFWRLSVGGGEEGSIRWTFMSRVGEGEAERVDDRTWVEAAGPVLTDERLYFAGRASFNSEEKWQLLYVPARSASGGTTPIPAVLPDRLAVERQLARVKAGLPLQEASEVRRHRSFVLDPPIRADADTPGGS